MPKKINDKLRIIKSKEGDAWEKHEDSGTYIHMDGLRGATKRSLPAKSQ